MRALGPAGKAEGHFQRNSENFPGLPSYVRCCSVEGSPLSLTVVYPNMFVLKIRKFTWKIVRLDASDFCHWYTSKPDTVLNFNLSIIHLIALRLSCYFLCLNEQIFQMRFFLLLWKLLSYLLWLLCKNGTFIYLAVLLLCKAVFHFSINLIKMPCFGEIKGI